MAKKREPIVLSIEQALAMPYATLRFVHLGWRVIRLEPTPIPGRISKGDPNRYVGRPVAGEDRHSYYVAPNVGKEAMAVDLKQPEGQALLRRLVRELPADVVCTNTMPGRHASLGLDYETLSQERPQLIWCAVSAMGLAYPEVPGYDPAIQALCGYMDLTGDGDGPPLLCGPPIVDLKAGDEVFAQVLLAMLEREQAGRGKKIDISMAQVAVSWLQTFLPMLDMGSPPEELRRNGNEHRQFVPVNAYPTQDGFIYMALGSDAQWTRLVRLPLFAGIAAPALLTNEGRRQHRQELHEQIAAITRQHTSEAMGQAFAAAEIPFAPISRIEQVTELPFVKESLLNTVTPDGKRVRLPPPAVSTPFLQESQTMLRFAPAYGEQTDALLSEVGVQPDDIADLRSRGIVA